MAEKFSVLEFERLALEADLRRQAREIKEGEVAAQVERANAERQLAEMSAGTVPTDPRVLPSAPGGEIVTPQTFEQTQFLKRAARTGVELDIRTGAPSGLRALASQVPEEPSAQLAFWKGKLGNEKVDLVDGRYVLRGVRTKDGNVKDLVVDEEQMSSKDLADALREAPEFVASVIGSFPSPAAVATRSAQLMNLVLKPALRGAAAFQAVKQAKDIGARIALDLPVDPTKNLLTAAEQGAWDAAFGMALGGLPIGLGKAAEASREAIAKPAKQLAEGIEGSGVGLVQAQGLIAREALAKTPGVDIPVTAGQLTGFAPMIRLQQIAEKIPIVGSRIATAKAKQAVKEQELQRILVSREPSSENLGRLLIAEIRQPIQREEMELATMKKLLGDEQTAKMARAFALDLPETSGLEAALGLKHGVDSVYSNWRAENAVNYGKVYSLPQAQDRSIPTRKILETLNDVVLERQAKREVSREFTERELATAKEGIKEPSVPLPQKAPESLEKEISLAALEEYPIKGTLPSGISNLAQTVKGFGDFATLQEMVDLRGKINEAIQNPDILPGVDDYMRKQISHSITETIKEYTGRVENKSLKDALEFANKRYADKVELFESPGVRSLLLPREGRFAVNLDEYADSIFRGGKGAVERYQRVKNLIGESSEEVRAFRQYFLQQLGKPSVNALTRTIEFEKLADVVAKIPKEIADDLFPQSRQVILESARAGAFAKGKLNFDEIAGLIEGDSLSKEAIEQIGAKQSRLDELLRNRIFRAVRDGEIDDISVQPDIFLDTVIFSDKVPISNLRDMMTVIRFRNPDVADAISQKYAAKMFREAADSAAQENITLSALGRPERTVDPAKFGKFFASPERRERLLAVLGDQRFDVLNNFAQHLATRQFAESTGKSAGGLLGGTILADIFSAKNWAKMARIGAMSALLSDSRLLRLISTPPPKGVEPSKWSKYLLRVAVLTPEFRRMMASELSDEDLQIAAEQIEQDTRP